MGFCNPLLKSGLLSGSIFPTDLTLRNICSKIQCKPKGVASAANRGRMIEVIWPSSVIFHLGAFEFEYKVEENVRGYCERNGNQRCPLWTPRAPSALTQEIDILCISAAPCKIKTHSQTPGAVWSLVPGVSKILQRSWKHMIILFCFFKMPLFKIRWKSWIAHNSRF